MNEWEKWKTGKTPDGHIVIYTSSGKMKTQWLKHDGHASTHCGRYNAGSFYCNNHVGNTKGMM